MNIRFDFIIHWLWSIAFAVLALSGLAMAGAGFGWILNYDISTADFIHRIFAAIYVLLTFVAIVYEIIRGIQKNEKRLAWFVIGRSTGYQIFTFITTLIFIVTGVIIWVCMDSNMSAIAFALYIHEKLTYLTIASLIWHIYMKCHALLWPAKPQPKQPQKNPT